MLLPRNLEEEETQRDKQRKYSENLTGQAGQTTSEEIGNSAGGAGPTSRGIGISQTRSGLGP